MANEYSFIGPPSSSDVHPGASLSSFYSNTPLANTQVVDDWYLYKRGINPHFLQGSKTDAIDSIYRKQLADYEAKVKPYVGQVIAPYTIQTPRGVWKPYTDDGRSNLSSFGNWKFYPGVEPISYQTGDQTNPYWITSKGVINEDLDYLRKYGVNYQKDHGGFFDEFVGPSILNSLNTSSGGLFGGLTEGNWANVPNSLIGSPNALFNGGNYMDNLQDAIPGGKTWEDSARAEGEAVGQGISPELRQILGRYAIPVIAGFFGPLGAAAGTYIGNQFAGGENKQGAINAGISYLGSGLASGLSPYIGTIGANTVSGAATGASQAAASNQDVGKGALLGGATGAISGAARPAVNYTSGYLNSLGINPAISNIIANAAYGSGSNALKAGISGGDAGRAALFGGMTAAQKAAIQRLGG